MSSSRTSNSGSKHRVAEQLSGLSFVVPKTIPYALQTVIHRARPGVLHTKKFLHTIRLSSTPNCPTCFVPEDTHHIITQCPQYNIQRNVLSNALDTVDDTLFCFVKSSLVSERSSEPPQPPG